MIALLEYGSGNLRCAHKALLKIGTKLGAQFAGLVKLEKVIGQNPKSLRA